MAGAEGVGSGAGGGGPVTAPSGWGLCGCGAVAVEARATGEALCAECLEGLADRAAADAERAESDMGLEGYWPDAEAPDRAAVSGLGGTGRGQPTARTWPKGAEPWRVETPETSV